MKLLLRLLLCLTISFTLVELPIMKSAHASDMITTSEVVDNLSRGEDHQRILEFIGRKEVQDQMIKLGVKPEEAKLRLVGLSDREMNKMAGEIESSTAGGDLGGILIIVLVILGILYLVKRI